MTQPQQPSIQLFVTGGTFDKEYDEITGRLFFKDSHVSEMLKLGRCLVDVQVRTLMMVDSLEMTQDDREIILKQCRTSPSSHIVITHGTDTMSETARVLGEAIQSAGLSEKTIVLTGAMVPYKFGSSDGLFNLGAALAFVQALPKGVYVVMNGRALPWHNVTKNRRTGEFSAKNE